MSKTLLYKGNRLQAQILTYGDLRMENVGFLIEIPNIGDHDFVFILGF